MAKTNGATHGKLLTVKVPTDLLTHMIRQKLQSALEKYENDMKQNIAEGTQPNSPSWWVGNIQSYVDVEDLGSGGTVIYLGVGLVSGRPEQVYRQAHIFNEGSKTPIMTVRGAFYNVDTGATEQGQAPPVWEHVNWAKGANHWFDKAENNFRGGFSYIADNIVRESVQALISSGAWQFKGHQISIKL